jgi:hypothetical protein
MDAQNLGSDGRFGWEENHSYNEAYDPCLGLIFQDDPHGSLFLDCSNMEWKEASKEVDCTNHRVISLPNEQFPATWGLPNEDLSNLTTINKYDNSMPGVLETAYHHSNLAWDASTCLVRDLEGHCPDLTATASSTGWSSGSSLHESAEAVLNPPVEHDAFMQHDIDSYQWIAALPTSANHMFEATEPFTGLQAGWSSLSIPDIDNIVVPFCPTNFGPLDRVHSNFEIDSVSIDQLQPRALLPKIRPEPPAPQKEPR